MGRRLSSYLSWGHHWYTAPQNLLACQGHDWERSMRITEAARFQHNASAAAADSWTKLVSCQLPRCLVHDTAPLQRRRRHLVHEAAELSQSGVRFSVLLKYMHTGSNYWFLSDLAMNMFQAALWLGCWVFSKVKSFIFIRDLSCLFTTVHLPACTETRVP